MVPLNSLLSRICSEGRYLGPWVRLWVWLRVPGSSIFKSGGVRVYRAAAWSAQVPVDQAPTLNFDTRKPEILTSKAPKPKSSKNPKTPDAEPHVSRGLLTMKTTSAGYLGTGV